MKVFYDLEPEYNGKRSSTNDSDPEWISLEFKLTLVSLLNAGMLMYLSVMMPSSLAFESGVIFFRVDGRMLRQNHSKYT